MKYKVITDRYFFPSQKGKTNSLPRVASSATALKELKIMKKIPQDAEATAVLVGE